jgi:hypothetical protein
MHAPFTLLFSNKKKPSFKQILISDYLSIKRKEFIHVPLASNNRIVMPLFKKSYVKSQSEELKAIKRLQAKAKKG